MKHRVLFLPAIVAVTAAALTVGCGSDDNKSPSGAATSVSGAASTTAAGAGTTVSGGATSVAGNVSSNTYPETKFNAKDYSYDFPDSINGGMVRLTITNTGKEPHQAQIARLNPGVTTQQFMDALKSPDESASLKLVSLQGGPNTVDPGNSQSVVLNLAPGQYALLCFVSGEDDIPHLAKGMIKMFTVNPPSGTQPAAPDTSDKVTMADYSFQGVTTLSPGKHTLAVTNAGPQPHEMTILKLKPGVTIDTLKQMIASEGGPGAATPPAGGTPATGATTAPVNRTPGAGATGTPGNSTPSSGAAANNQEPVTDAGGMGALDKGATGWVDVNLDAGNYAFVCFVPDAKTGAPHAALGMITAFTVK